jgi:protein-tyrosine phosphatase
MLSGTPDDEDPVEAAGRFMIEEYERFSALPGTRAAVGQVIRMIGDARSVLVSRFAGKDRTGLAVAVVLEAVGVDADLINADFLASNASVPALRERILRTIEARSDSLTPELLDYVRSRLPDQVLGVRAEYLEAACRRSTASTARWAGFSTPCGARGPRSWAEAVGAERSTSIRESESHDALRRVASQDSRSEWAT